MARPTTIPVSIATSVSGQLNRVEPGSVIQSEGYLPGMVLPPYEHDYMFGWLTDWVNYFAGISPFTSVLACHELRLYSEDALTNHIGSAWGMPSGGTPIPLPSGATTTNAYVSLLSPATGMPGARDIRIIAGDNLLLAAYDEVWLRSNDLVDVSGVGTGTYSRLSWWSNESTPPLVYVRAEEDLVTIRGGGGTTGLDVMPTTVRLNGFASVDLAQAGTTRFQVIGDTITRPSILTGIQTYDWWSGGWDIIDGTITLPTPADTDALDYAMTSGAGIIRMPLPMIDMSGGVDWRVAGISMVMQKGVLSNLFTATLWRRRGAAAVTVTQIGSSLTASTSLVDQTASWASVEVLPGDRLYLELQMDASSGSDTFRAGRVQLNLTKLAVD